MVSDPNKVETAWGVFTHAELQAAFNKVGNKDNWKYPINTIISLENPEKEIPIIRAAIQFIAGCEAAIDYTYESTLSKPRVSVMACGYYTAIGP